MSAALGPDLVWGAFLLAAFLAAALLAQALASLWLGRFGPAARRLDRRLRALGRLSAEEAGSTAPAAVASAPQSAVDALLQRLGWARGASHWLAQAGVAGTPGRWLTRAGISALLAALAAALLGLPPAGALLSGVAMASVWPAVVQYRRTQRLRQLERQLPDALDLLARSMQAGHSLGSALMLVAGTGPQPIAREFRAVFDEMHFGASASQAFHALAARLGGTDARFFVAAVLLQSRTGGRLAQVLQSIAALMRERERLRGRIRVLAADGRSSAWILSLLPFVLATALAAVNHDFISALWTDPIGLRMATGALALMALGIVWMWRLVRIRI